MLSNPIDQNWPTEDLEYVLQCPACSSYNCAPEYKSVKDWSFMCAPGSWDYWRCKSCRSLYLNPRPTDKTIGRAYQVYYTHGSKPPEKGKIGLLLERLRNECIFHWIGADFSPRLNLRFGILLLPLKPFIKLKYPLELLKGHLPGSMLDVGCGNGDLMIFAKAMGYSVEGVEIDPAAVKAATVRGLHVTQGSFDIISTYASQFDYIVCSHVIEHVHEPKILLERMLNAVKPGGHVFVTWPNPNSLALRIFGIHWRGLEAPRHISLISENAISTLLQSLEVSNIRLHASGIHTFGESMAIRNRGTSRAAKILNKLIHVSSLMAGYRSNQDFVTVSFQRAISATSTTRV